MIWKSIKLAALMLATVLVTLLGVRAYSALQGPELRPWHTFAPVELSANQLHGANWAEYIEAENRIFRSVQENVVARTEAEDKFPANRYFEGSLLNASHFQQDWNRSFILTPQGEPKGAAVLLHGLTDSPYSLRHIARHYADRGFVAVVIRLPGHGTVPGGLTDIVWEDWSAAVELAVREAVQRAGTGKPLHIIGYSNGGALAVKYTLDSLYRTELAKPDRVVLLSPMIGVTSYVRFAGLAALPAYFPAFVKSSWLNILPEFNPFKYNSFPVNAARQSYRLTAALQAELEKVRNDDRLGGMPPILAFQSVVDNTVSTRAVVRDFYDRLPKNGSELVLFDVNRTQSLNLLLRSSADTALSSLLGLSARAYRTAVIGNTSGNGGTVAERTVEAGATVETVKPLGLSFPTGVFSLSHIALPFPPDDSLYGGFPKPGVPAEFGVNLGAAALRGEQGVLVVTLDTVMRLSYNPFFSYMIGRIDEVIDQSER